MYTDAHAHLDYYKDVKSVIDKCREKNVLYIVTSGLNPESNRKSLELSQKFEIVKPALGFYPQYAIINNDEIINKELNFIEEKINNIVAISEIGLDKNYGSFEKQKKVFIDLIKLGIRYNKTIVVHSRKMEKETINIIEETVKKYNHKYRKVVMHCFMGNMKLVKRILKNNWFLSIPCIIKRSSHFKVLVKNSPIRNLLTETDSPFLSPEKGKINYPYNVVLTVKEIANIKGLNEEEVRNNIFMNFSYLFL